MKKIEVKTNEQVMDTAELTEQELETILAGSRRWCGPGTNRSCEDQDKDQDQDK